MSQQGALSYDVWSSGSHVRVYTYFLLYSGSLTRILSILADNQTIQNRLRVELVEAKDERDVPFDYESINALPYLDAIVHESLRLCSPGLRAFGRVYAHSHFAFSFEFRIDRS